MISVEPGTVVVYADIACPWSHVAVHRLHATRRRLGLEGRVSFDMRAFPLELVNRRETPRRILDAEIPVAGALEPDAGWQVWQAPDWCWPVTTLPALEAVQAAKLQGLRASEQLDRGLRMALFGQSRCISMTHVIDEVARLCPAVDAQLLDTGMASGVARADVMEQFEQAQDGVVLGSPHLFFADGASMFNPGVRVRWEGEHGRGFPVVEADDPSVYEAVLRRAADPAGATVAG